MQASKIQFTIEKLENILNLAKSAKDTSQNLAFYILKFKKEYDINSELEPIVKSYTEERNSDMGRLNAAENEFIQIMENIAAQIEKYIHEKDVQNNGLTESLKHFYAYGKKQIESSQGPVGGRCFELKAMLTILSNDPKHSNFVSKFKVYNKESQPTGELIFSQACVKWEQEAQRCERLQKTWAWYHFYKIIEFREVYEEYESIGNEKIKNNELFGFMDLNEKLKNLTSNDLVAYINHMQIVFDDTKMKMQEIIQQSIPWFYYEISRTLYIGQEVITLGKDKKSHATKFKAYNFRVAILRLLSSRATPWAWDEAHEEIDKKELPENKGKQKKIQRKIYDTCKGLVETIAKKTGITDFLIYDMQTFQTHPNYKYDPDYFKDKTSKEPQSSQKSI